MARGVRVGVLEGVERIGAGFDAQFKLVVGAVVVDEDRDGVRVLCPEKRDVDARVLALGEHDSRGASWGVIVRVVHVSPSRSVLAVHELTLCTERAP
jgi:hypothetical protein